ncbi:hypothetical protein WOLCODRAFT_128223, partial [Wolfiporia cocos MD-104 SS10]
MTSNELANYVWGVTVDDYVQLSSASLLLYEYVITIEQEVNFIWSSKAKRSTVIFLVNRCVMLGMAISNIVSIINWSTLASYEGVIVLQDVFYLTSLATWAAVSGLRTYVVCNRSWQMASLTLLFGLVPIASNIAMYASEM